MKSKRNCYQPKDHVKQQLQSKRFHVKVKDSSKNYNRSSNAKESKKAIQESIEEAITHEEAKC
jgi:hypothetical protein